MPHHEKHYVEKSSWLRAAVLGANDGIVSTASLVIGVAAANVAYQDILLAGLAGLVAGAMSMAAGEYVSVSSQRDMEQADIAREKHELLQNPEHELAELTQIYQQRGLDAQLAKQVAEQLMAHDALEAHVRDELGFTEHLSAKPVQAALSSAACFAVGAALALLPLLFSQFNLIISIAVCSLLALATLGAIAAKTGGAAILPAVIRVTFWGALAMLITAGIGHLASLL